MTQPSPVDTLHDAAERLRKHAPTGAYTATPAGAALLRAREPLADWLEHTVTTLAASTHPGWLECVAPHALAVARAILGEDQT
ncbi:hypothetical protein ACFUMI_38315 [Streptomyces sp. NPDC057273]|uniref:hypothetical protein n=1 Tax=Streptomyces sp. NPDC057273 TaxID=3346080 RepID=UPI00363A6C4F